MTSAVATRPGSAAPDSIELGGEKKVFIVEENTKTRELILDSLRDFILGIQVIGAETQEEARRKFELEAGIAVIVIAANISGGGELVRHLRQNFPLDKPIIALGLGAKGRRSLMDAGCNHQCNYFGIVIMVQDVL